MDEIHLTIEVKEGYAFSISMDEAANLSYSEIMKINEAVRHLAIREVGTYPATWDRTTETLTVL